MIDEEIASVLEDAGYQFNAATRRYDVTTGATEGEEDGHSSTFVADELGIPEEDLARWEEERVAEAGTTGEAPQG
ncbi:MAG: hypothetical protein ACAI43_01415 [Phycisphaerae bacterium]|nr:hypothetical protein [Tepidisphaeraceae bacterium]